MSRLEEIRARTRAASLPPWTGGDGETDGTSHSHWGCGPAVATAEQAEADGAFIAMAREDIPWMSARMKELAEVAKACCDPWIENNAGALTLKARAALAKLEES